MNLRVMNVLQLKKQIGSYIQNFAIYFWANEKVTACENNDQGLVSTMITLKKEINIVLRQTHIDYAKLCMHYFDSNLF